MGLVHTPEECFDDLPDYPYEPQYVDVCGPELAYIDEASDESPLNRSSESDRALVPVPNDERASDMYTEGI